MDKDHIYTKILEINLSDIKCPICKIQPETGEFGEGFYSKDVDPDIFFYFPCNHCQEKILLYFRNGEIVDTRISPENFIRRNPNNN